MLGSALGVSVVIAVSAIGYDGVTFDMDIGQCTPMKKTKGKMFSAAMVFVMCYLLPTGTQWFV